MRVLCDITQKIIHQWLECVWIPIFFPLLCLDVIRVNAFVIADAKSERPLNHKMFINNLIHALLQRAVAHEYQRTRKSVEWLTTPQASKKPCVSSNNPQLPAYRLDGKPDEHKHAMEKVQRACTYCSWIRQIAKNDGSDTPPKIVRTKNWCIRCLDPICTKHWKNFHGWST